MSQLNNKQGNIWNDGELVKPFSPSKIAFLKNRKEKEVMKNSYKLSTVMLAALLLMIIPFNLLAQDAENLTFLGNWGMGGGEIRAVSNQGDLAYYGVGNVLKIVSFEDPANPYAAGSVTLDDMVEDIVWTVLGGQTYCLVSGSSLNIVNVTNPISPSVTATLSLAGYGEGLAASGSYAYLAVGSTGMEVVDFSDPANPTSVATIAGAGSGYAEGINVSTPYAYLANGANVSIFDISTPASPTLTGSYTRSDDEWIQDAMPRGNYVYSCAYSAGIDVIDVSNPASPTLVTSLANGKNADIMFDGDYGYIASREFGLTVLDVSTPTAPTIINTFSTNGVLRKVSYGAISLSGTITGHIFTAEVSALGAVNVSAPASMAYSGFVEVNAPADGICYTADFDGNIAYVAYYRHIRALDITSPSAMTELGNYLVADTAVVKKVVHKDHIVYAPSKMPGLKAIDFSNPSNPTLLATVIDVRVNDVAISGDYVYAATSDNGIGIVDVSTANAPVLVGYAAGSTDLYGEGVSAYGDVMVQSTWDALYFFDISTPEAPTLADSQPLVTGTSWLTLDANYAYVHDFDTLRIFDISTLTDVVQVSAIFTDGSWDGDAAREGNYVYVNVETNGIKVYDVSDITAPVEVAHYDMLNVARGISVRNGMAYVGEKEGGLSVYRNDLVVSIDTENMHPTQFALSQNYPNPFNPTTLIQYEIPQSFGAGNVRLEVFNVLGQHVQTLVDGNQSSGLYQVRWDGLGSSGQQQVGGIYFYTLTAGEQTLTNKMILLK